MDLSIVMLARLSEANLSVNLSTDPGWWFQQIMENGPFIDGLPIKNI